MARRSEFVEYLVEQLEPCGEVTARSMFGGFGLFRNGLMFAVVVDDTLYFKADEVNRPEFEKLKRTRFTYQRQGKVTHLSYYQPPENALEDSDELCAWAESAYQAAVRNAGNKGKKKRA